MSRKPPAAALLAWISFAQPLLPAVHTAEPAKSAAPKEGLAALLPTDSTTKPHPTVDGQSIAYTVHAGTTTLRDEEGRPLRQGLLIGRYKKQRECPDAPSVVLIQLLCQLFTSDP